MLVVVYGLEKFYYYVYGCYVVVELDYKLLEVIFKKFLFNVLFCIVRMLLCIQKYDVEIMYVFGKNILFVDVLLCLSLCVGEIIVDIDI